MGQSPPSHSSPPNAPPGWETKSADSNADLQLTTWQGKIISQIVKTQKVIWVQIWLNFIYATIFASFFGPYLILNMAPRMRIYGFILLIFLYSIAELQFFRKWVILKEVHSFRKKSKKSQRRLHSQSQESFFPVMTEFFQKLYEVLFFDRKSHRLPCKFLETHSDGQSEQIEHKVLRSLRNDIKFTAFIIILYLIPSILVKMLLKDPLDNTSPVFLFVGLFVVGGALLWISVAVKSVMEQWMLGFIKLRGWVSFIEQENEIDGPQDEFQSNPKQNDWDLQSQNQSKDVCGVCGECGEPGQQNREFCQNCGRKISK